MPAYNVAVCRIQGYGKGRPGYQLIVLDKGTRQYLFGGTSTGPVWRLQEKGEAATPEEARRACEEAAKRLGITNVRVVVPQKAPKNKVGHGIMYRLGLDHVAKSIKARFGRKIAVLPAGIVQKVIAPAKVRSNAKKFALRAKSK